MKWPFASIHQRLGIPLLIPLYHSVSDAPLPHIAPIYPVRTVREFTEDVETLLLHYQPVSQSQIRQHLSGEKPLQRPSFHLTFDDGLRACAETIAPILTRYGIPATFFLNPPMLDNRALMFRYKAALLAANSPHALRLPHWQEDKLDQLAAEAGLSWEALLQHERPYMTLTEVGELAQAGFSLGAHSNSHPMMPAIPVENAVNEAVSSWRWVAQHFPGQQPAFAFPFTASGMSATFWQQLQVQQPDDWLTFGTAGLKKHHIPWHLERLPVEKSRLPMKIQLLNAYAGWAGKALLGKNKIYA